MALMRGGCFWRWTASVGLRGGAGLRPYAVTRKLFWRRPRPRSWVPSVYLRVTSRCREALGVVAVAPSTGRNILALEVCTVAPTWRRCSSR